MKHADGVDAARTERRPKTSRGRGLQYALARNHALVTLGLFLIECLIIFLLTHIFFNPTNIRDVLRQSSIVVIVASAGTLVMVSGGLDISVGSVVALSGVVAAYLAVAEQPLIVVMLGAVVAGGLVGLLNGAIVVGLRVTPIIVTLGTLYLARGLAYIFAKGQAVVIGIPDYFAIPGQSFVGPVPTPVVLAAIVVTLFYVLLHHTLLGKYTYAIGGNRETAVLSGIGVGRVQILLYTLSGMAAGLGGIILASRLGSGQPSAATGYEFDVIIAIVLGGTSLAGGSGTIIGTLLGALFVAALGNGLDLLGIGAFYQYVALGLVLILAVVLDVTLSGEGVQMRWGRRAAKTASSSAFVRQDSAVGGEPGGGGRQ